MSLPVKPLTPLQVTVAYSPAARKVLEVVVTLAPGSTVADAIRSSELAKTFVDSGLNSGAVGAVGVWGRKAAPDQALLEGDRVEIYRPLTVDPKVARRERFAKQGAKKAGLFVKRRDGAKAGY
jgi:putative ubiquitin-RnfH superfamily antitoxin RatB of RatAB toxin-antitoxin module